jgi:hypothetical protein
VRLGGGDDDHALGHTRPRQTRHDERNLNIVRALSVATLPRPSREPTPIAHRLWYRDEQWRAPYKAMPRHAALLYQGSRGVLSPVLAFEGSSGARANIASCVTFLSGNCLYREHDLSSRDRARDDAARADSCRTANGNGNGNGMGDHRPLDDRTPDRRDSIPLLRRRIRTLGDDIRSVQVLKFHSSIDTRASPADIDLTSIDPGRRTTPSPCNGDDGPANFRRSGSTDAFIRFFRSRLLTARWRYHRPRPPVPTGHCHGSAAPSTVAVRARTSPSASRTDSWEITGTSGSPTATSEAVTTTAREMLADRRRRLGHPHDAATHRPPRCPLPFAIR